MGEPYVYIVDDDADMRDSLSALLESAQFTVRAFDSANGFLSSDVAWHRGCLLTDVRMPDMDGLELQNELARRNWRIPVIIMTGHADVPLAVRAMKAGAIDFLEKPFDEETLFDSIRRALDVADSDGEQGVAAREAEAKLTRLTSREREVLDRLVAGHANKVIAHELSISPRTVEIHRARVMEKMEVRSVAELVRLVIASTQR